MRRIFANRLFTARARGRRVTLVPLSKSVREVLRACMREGAGAGSSAVAVDAGPSAAPLGFAHFRGD